MARIEWAYQAISSLSEIVAYNALDDPSAAERLAERVFSHCEQLAENPKSGPVVPEIPRSGYRQLIEPPCRIFYRIEGDLVYIVNIVRTEQLFRPSLLDSDE